MTRKPRYTLLILGILFFAVAAPVLVLYVQGKLPLPGNRRIQPTGIISVTSDPSGAEVYVNNKLEDTTPASVRFVPTGDYDIRIYKNGYWEWHKKLPVVAGRVTYANPNPDKQILLRRQTPQELASDVNLYAPHGKGLAYTRGLTLVLIPNLNEPERTINTSLSELPTELITNLNGTYIGVRTARSFLIIKSDDLTVTDVSTYIPAQTQVVFTEYAALALTPENNLLSLSFDQINNKPVTLATKVYAYRVRESDLYYMQQGDEFAALYHATISTNGLSGNQLLAQHTPIVTPRLYIDNTKAVFVLSEKTLYRINTRVEAIAHDVTTSSDQTGTLSYTTAGELWWYDSGSNTSRLVSRNGEGFTSPVVQPTLQYALFVQGAKLVALELDDRGEQNRYVLDTADGLNHLQYLNSETLTYLAGNSLRTLTLR